MKKEDVLRKGDFKEITKKGAMFDNGEIVVPVEYDYVSRAKENLFVATKGSANGYRTYGIEATVEENGRKYGEYFNEQLKNKTLDTDLHFYTIDGQIHMKEKIIACIACFNDDMIILLKEGYRWSIALIDYENLTITEIEEYSNLEYLKSEYTDRRFVIQKNDGYFVVSFDTESKVKDFIPMNGQEPVEFSDNGIIIKENNKYGFMRYEGEVIVNCFWDKIKLHREFIEVERDEKTAIYLYNGYMGWYEEIVSFEKLYVRGTLLFKVKNKNGYYSLYSISKQILPYEFNYLEVLSDGTAIIGIPGKGYALVKCDVERSKATAILPTNCFDNTTELFSEMKFIFSKAKLIVEAVKGRKCSYYDTCGKQITKLNLTI